MLEESRLPPSFLGQAVSAYVHIWNRCSTSLDSKTPYELIAKYLMSHISEFGGAQHMSTFKRTSGLGLVLIWKSVFL